MMRLLRRNLTRFRYANYVTTATPTPVLDADGNETGEYTQPYAAPKTGWANIITPLGPTNHDTGYGDYIPYSRQLVTPVDYGITEQSHLWIDDVDGTNYDYVVSRVAKWKNTYRLTAVRVTHNDASNY